MTGNESQAVNQFRRLAVAPQADALLLARFLADTDAEAFGELVRRHGPMVLGVCRRVLGNGPDVDDAFQAAFIILARKGGSIRSGRSVASWLFGVARFAALRARARARRQRTHEARAGREVRVEGGTDPEMLAAVDEELQRLPDRYREPLVACFLQGRTQEDAARQTGCSLSTLRRRLERGRELLRRRLTGRGVAPALGALAVGAGGPPVSAEVVTTTTALVVSVVNGGAPAVPAAALAEGVLAMMARTKWKVVTAVLAVALFGGGVAWHLEANPPPAGVPPTAAKAKPAEPPEKGKGGPEKDRDVKVEQYRIKPGDRLTVRVRGTLSEDPIDGQFEVEASGKIPLGPLYGRVKIDGLTPEEAEPVILQHLLKFLRSPMVSVVRYSPTEGHALELRLQQLEREVKQLRALVEELRKQKP